MKKKLKEEINDKDEEIADLVKSIKMLERQIEKKNFEFGDLRREKEEWEAKISACDNQNKLISQLNEIIKNLNDEINSLKKEISDKNIEELDYLKQKNNELIYERDFLLNENKNLKITIQNNQNQKRVYIFIYKLIFYFIYDNIFLFKNKISIRNN